MKSYGFFFSRPVSTRIEKKEEKIENTILLDLEMSPN